MKIRERQVTEYTIVDDYGCQFATTDRNFISVLTNAFNELKSYDFSNLSLTPLRRNLTTIFNSWYYDYKLELYSNDGYSGKVENGTAVLTILDEFGTRLLRFDFDFEISE